MINMRFVNNGDGELVLQTGQNILQEMNRIAPISNAFIIDVPHIKKGIKEKGRNILTNQNFAVAGTATGAGVFWKAFMLYIFPWMLDVAKVYCLVRIAQAFYQEKRGGRDEGTGLQALVTHGKWYLAFWLLPLGVELIDGIGSTMYTDLKDQNIMQTLKNK